MDDLTRALQAWHGSPHDFEEFRDDKIGTGEGTKAMGGYGIYGHGHYVAEERKVGEEYRDRLHHRVNAVPESVLFRGKHAGMVHDVLTSYVNGLLRIEKEEKDLAKVTDPALRKEDQKYIKLLKETTDNLKSDINGLFPEFLKLDQPIQDVVVDMFGQSVSGDPLVAYSKFLTNLQNHPTYAPGSPNREKLDKAHEFMLPHIKDFQGPQPKEGRLYELNLHVGPHELLDWDDRLENHHDDAISKILSIPEVEDGTHFENEDENTRGWELVGGQPNLHPEYSTGQEVYKHLVKETGSAVKASNRLLEYGIRGIRYKDQGSRGQQPGLLYEGSRIDHSHPMFEATGYLYDGDGLFNSDGSLNFDVAVAKRIIDSLREVGLTRKKIWENDAALVDGRLQDHLGRGKEFYQNHLDVAEELSMRPEKFTWGTPKPTYNYVIFDPTAIKIMRKLGMKGEVIKDFTDTGVHVKPRK